MGDTVAVSGTGPIGLAAIQFAKAAGARRVVAIGTNDAKFPLLKKYGADVCINSKTCGNLAATDAGLGSVYIMGAIAALNANPALVAKLGLPEGFVPTAAIALGHPAKPLAVREAKEKIAVDYLN